MIKNLVKRVICIYYKIKFRKKASISHLATVLGRCDFEGKNRIGKNNYLKDVKIGLFTYMGTNNEFERVNIGRYCSIGNNIKLVSSNHPLDFVSTHTVFYNSAEHSETFNKDYEFKEIIADESGVCLDIGNDVWIGDNVIIKGGLHIGNGAVLGMGAVVTKDVPPYAIVGGNPAKIIRYRFDEEIISRLQKLKWWDWQEEKIQKYAHLFNNPQELITECLDKEELSE